MFLAAVLAAGVAIPFAASTAAAASPVVTTYAGTGTVGAPTPGPAEGSDLADPTGVAEDSAGDVYVADFVNSVVEKITPDGTLSVIAGTGSSGVATPGPATSSELQTPDGLALDAAGDLYVSDPENSEVYELTPAGTLSVVAGTGVAGTPSAGAATRPQLDWPTGLVVDTAGDLYISDADSHQVLEVTPSGTLSVVAGNGTSGEPTAGPATSSELADPNGLAVNSAGDLYIADPADEVVDEVTPGGALAVVAGVAGEYGYPTPGPATASELNAPGGLALDSAGDLLIADADNGGIDEVTPGGTLSVVMQLTQVLSGSPVIGYAPAVLNRPIDLAADPSGTIYMTASDKLLRYGLATPGAPTSLTATRNGASALLTFAAPSDHGLSAISGYEVSLDGGSSWRAATPAGASTLTATVGGLSSSSSLQIEVKAVNSAGAGPASAAVDLTATAPPPTPTPTPIPTPAPSPTPTPTPSTTPPPPSAFSAVAKVSKAGMLSVVAHVPAAGKVQAVATEADPRPSTGMARAAGTSLAGLLTPGSRRFAYATGSATATATSTVTATLHVTAAGRAIIARHHARGWSLHVRITVLYTDANGAAQELTLAPTEILAAAQRKHARG